MRDRRTLASALLLLLSILGAGSVVLLQRHSDAARDAEVDAIGAGHAAAAQALGAQADAAQLDASIIRVAVLVLLVGAFWLLHSRRARLVAQLEAAQRERAHLLDRTVAIAESERMRIAADLHDGPIQQLTAIAMRVDRATARLGRGDVDGGAALLEEVRTGLTTEMASLRRLMSELRPPAIDERGIGAALRDCAAQVLGETGVAFAVSASVAPTAVAPESEAVVYRVAREALANVRKHAGATAVAIVVETCGDHLRLVVSDDGCGFDVDRPADGLPGDHLGIPGMRERTESVGGRLEITASPGAGTRVDATIPWKPRAAA
jgi:two-component system NarL family sensor kinase